MGGFMRANLFRGVDHEQVNAALTEFWEGEGYRLEEAGAESRDNCYALHQELNGWTAMEWTIGWEWDLRRRAQLHVSRTYDCPGLLTFVYDGDLWGYELFHHGEAVDHFVQWTEPGFGFFHDLPREGRPEVLVAQFPDLSLDVEHARGYLTSVSIDDPAYEHFDWDPNDPRNRPVRDGDHAGRLDAEAVYDFWRFLGVNPPEMTVNGFFASSVHCRFTTQLADGHP
jgi:hypothetical protein